MEKNGMRSPLEHAPSAILLHDGGLSAAVTDVSCDAMPLFFLSLSTLIRKK